VYKLWKREDWSCEITKWEGTPLRKSEAYARKKFCKESCSINMNYERFQVLIAGNMGILFSGFWCRLFRKHWLPRMRLIVVFPQSIQIHAGIILRLGHDRFLPNPFEFTNHLPRSHFTLYNLDITTHIRVTWRWREHPVLKTEMRGLDVIKYIVWTKNAAL
jgi:hypothetical protein